MREARRNISPFSLILSPSHRSISLYQQLPWRMGCRCLPLISNRRRSLCMDKPIESKPPAGLSQFWFGPIPLVLAALLIAVVAGAMTYMYNIKFVELLALVL